MPLQVQQTETAPATPNGKAPMPSPSLSSATSPTTPGCTPTTSLLRFDGGYEVSMCYRTPDGVEGQAKAGLYASAESGLLWFFSRENAEVLVKVLNGCAINGHRWVFGAPVTTLEFDLWVTSPTGARWTHGNTQGVTAATKSDVAAFACVDEPEAALDLAAPGISLSDATAVAGQRAGDNIETPAKHPEREINRRRTRDAAAATNGEAPMPSSPSSVPVPSPAPATSPSTPGCMPTTGLLHFDGGYEVSMCYRTPDTPDGTEGVDGQAKAGLYASAESGLLWFFSRDNAEVLVKVLDDCAINGHRWVFVAPVTTLEFDLWVTSPTGKRWNHTNTQGVTAATKSDVAAFACADEPESAPDLIVSDVTVSDASPVVGQTIALRTTVRNDGEVAATPTTMRYYRSDDSTIGTSLALKAPRGSQGSRTDTSPGAAPVHPGRSDSGSQKAGIQEVRFPLSVAPMITLIGRSSSPHRSRSQATADDTGRRPERGCSGTPGSRCRGGSASPAPWFPSRKSDRSTLNRLPCRRQCPMRCIDGCSLSASEPCMQTSGPSRDAFAASDRSLLGNEAARQRHSSASSFRSAVWSGATSLVTV